MIITIISALYIAAINNEQPSTATSSHPQQRTAAAIPGKEQQRPSTATNC
jgi:hypothetical protein